MLKDELAKIYWQKQDNQDLINEFHQAKNYTVISADKVDWSGDEIELYVTKISNNLLKISDFETTDYDYQCAITGDNYWATEKTIANDDYIQ